MANAKISGEVTVMVVLDPTAPKDAKIVVVPRLCAKAIPCESIVTIELFVDDQVVSEVTSTVLPSE